MSGLASLVGLVDPQDDWKVGVVSEAECEMSGLPPAYCAHCRGVTLYDPIEVGEVISKFTARFPGKCDACGDRIRPGDELGMTRDKSYVCKKHLS